MTPSPYHGPSVHGYDTDAPLRRAAGIVVHTSPLAALGGKDAGGMNVYVRELACHVARLGIPVDLFTRRTVPNTPEVIDLCPGVRVVSITAGPPAPLSKNELFPYLPEFAEQMAVFSLRDGARYDVVHAHYWLSGWVAHLLRRYWETPFVQMFHTTAHMKNAVAATKNRESDQRLQVERRLLGLADSVIAANPDERADLIWRQGAPAQRVCTVPPGVDLNLFHPRDGRPMRDELGIASNIPVVLFVGRVDPIKGIETLLDATRLLVDDERFAVKPLLLFVGGDLNDAGEPEDALADVVSQATALGIADQVRFLGSRPQEDLSALYAAADVVAVPSRYESFGLVAVEAMACGTPVVASRVGGLTFTVEEESSGLLVPMGSAPALAQGLARVLLDDDLRSRMAVQSRVAAERFGWPTVAGAIIHVYERLAAGQRANLCCDEEIYA